MESTRTPLLAALLVLLTLTACGKKDDRKAVTQVAAKVGTEEISVQQINLVLSRSNAANASPQAIQSLRRDVLEKLIDQQLAADQAIEAKLHRAPEVAAMIEAARREVLARAYVQQLTSALPKPTPDEAQKYYAEHPALFAERRVFGLQEVQLPATAGDAVAEQVRALLNAGKALDEVGAFLKSRDIKFGGSSASRAAEQIPLELLTKLHALKDGQALVLKTPQGYNVVRVASSQLSPVPEANALPRIEQFLANQRGAEVVSQAIKQLRAKVSIDYMGDFAPSAIAAPTAPNKDTTQSTIDKGVAKLK